MNRREIGIHFKRNFLDSSYSIIGRSMEVKMRLKEYVEIIQVLAEKHPDALVVYSRDDEGNGFQEVHYKPCSGHFYNGEYSEFKENCDEERINAICIN